MLLWEKLIENGGKVLVSFYGGSIETSDLIMVRYEQYMRKIASAKKNLI